MNETDKALLRKFLDGRCDDTELDQVARILADQKNADLLDKLMEEETAGEWTTPIVDDDEEYINKRIVEAHNRIRQMELADSNEEAKNRRIIKINWLRYVAVFAGVLFLTSLAYFQIKNGMTNSQITYVEKRNPKGLPVRYILPDSSEVLLGAGSTLTYPEVFKEENREIILTGEAFFTVTHMPEKPFIVRTGGISTQVLGTSFKIEAFEDQPLEVAVATGKVAVTKETSKQTEKLALLTPGLKVAQNLHTGKYEIATVDIGDLENWKSGDLVFATSLELAVQKLQRRYGANIYIANPEVRQNRMIATFSATESLQDVLELMSLVGKFRYEKKNENNYILYDNE